MADLNGDGKPDLVVANSAERHGERAAWAKATATFGPQHTFATGRQPFSVAVADINGDGIPDIVTANAFDNTVSVLLGNGDGIVSERSRPSRSAPGPTRSRWPT